MSNPTYIVNKAVVAGLLKTLFADKDFLTGDLTMNDGDNINISIDIRLDGKQLRHYIRFSRFNETKTVYDDNTGNWVTPPLPPS